MPRVAAPVDQIRIGMTTYLKFGSDGNRTSALDDESPKLHSISDPETLFRTSSR
jgi:hypothetical protein